jgi:tRNA modification GTPase
VAAAWQALTQAPTFRTACILLDQFRGALDEALSRRMAQMADDLAAAADGLAELLRRGAIGKHLTVPWRVVIAGPPNVGKSSLLNALVGFERAMVFDAPGTTRDVVSVCTAMDGWPIELIDTAGLRAGGDELEAAGVRRTLDQLAHADLVLAVHTAEQASMAPDPMPLTGQLWLKVRSKCDLEGAHPACIGDGIPVSAVTGSGLPELMRQIVARLVPQPPDPGEAVPFSDRQLAMIGLAESHCRRSDRAAAIAALRALTTRG